jgi:hypothetical protein
MKQVFISYSHDDENVAQELRDSLRKKNLGWIDEARIAGGGAIRQKVKDSLQQASAIIVLVSKQSLKSEWVQFEIGAALAMNKPVIPILIGQTDAETVLPDWLQGIVYIDARHRPVRNAAEEVALAVLQGQSPSGE